MTPPTQADRLAEQILSHRHRIYWRQGMSAQSLGDITGLKWAAEVEKKCREAFDNYFHKVAATMTYDQWRIAFKVGFRCGREDCTQDWADHMTRAARTTSDIGSTP